MFNLVGTIELVLDIKATLGESPAWDHDNQLLYWVDILEKKVHIYNPVTKEKRCIILEKHIGAIAPKSTDVAVIALEDGFYFLNLRTEEVTCINNPETHIKNNRFNDGKCDAYGRFWAGTMDKSYVKGRGALYCLDTNLKVDKKLSSVGLSNGLTWSLDNKQLYYIDTLNRDVCCFEYNLNTGEIRNPVQIIKFAAHEGLPDGMTIDEEGMLWIAHWGGGKVSRWNPNTGKMLSAIDVPAINVTSCIFGGKDLDELYITTARDGLSAEQLQMYPYSGGLFKIQMNIKGIQTYSYKG